jgi:hypothetical protein
VGKSTLCGSLTAWLESAGLTVDQFKEEEVLTRREFAAVADEFTASGAVDADTLLAGTKQFVESTLSQAHDMVVADALMPFVPTLLAMGQSELQIDDFMDHLDRTLAPLRPLLIYLDGDPAVALGRAAVREGPGWLERYVQKLANYGVDPPVHNLESAIRYLHRERATTLRVAQRNAWRLALIDNASELTPADVLQQACQLVRQWIPAATSRSTCS